MVPQHGATTVYVVPSYGQTEKLDWFAPIGLTKAGFRMPPNWGEVQKALQAGYRLGQKTLLEFIAAGTPGTDTNYWGVLNNVVGTYSSNTEGYLYRSLIVVEGGVANIPLDAVYPTATGNPTQLDGNQTYKVTFTPPCPPYPTLPAVGIYPPMVSDSSGNPKGSGRSTSTQPIQRKAPLPSSPKPVS